jgi:N-methylhydantoinase B/oxoprolinase/acetone carboxylase alpha subunit
MLSHTGTVATGEGDIVVIDTPGGGGFGRGDAPRRPRATVTAAARTPNP